MSAPSTPARRIGVMGGSFDPIHIAHLLVAESVRETLSLEMILFLPVGQQPLKQGKPVAPAEHRVAMVELAIANNAAFGLSRIDVERPGPSYTADSIEQLQREWGDPERTALWFIIGSDSLLTFTQWREPQRILAHTRLAVVRRPDFSADFAPLEADIPGITSAIDWVDAPLMQISATDIRARVAEGRSIRYRVVEPVREYIEAQGLYR